MRTSKFNIVKETEKAINVELTVVVGGRGKEITWTFWLPKSVVKITETEMEVPAWCIGPKTMEIKGFVDFA